MLLDWWYKDVFWRFLKMQQTCRRFLGLFCSFFSPHFRKVDLIMWRGISPALLLRLMLEIKRESEVTRRFRLLLRCSVLKLPSCTLVFGGRTWDHHHHHHQTCLGGKLPEFWSATRIPRWILGTSTRRSDQSHQSIKQKLLQRSRRPPPSPFQPRRVELPDSVKYR